MAKTGFPSLTALLGLLAVAGYQNRDKLGELLGDGQRQPGAATGASGMPAGLDRILGGMGRGMGSGGPTGGLGGLASGGGIGGMLSSGIGELMERFRGAGQSEKAESWVKDGPNAPIQSSELEQALGPELLDELMEKTGLSREDLLERLSRELPTAIDRYTPEGRF